MMFQLRDTLERCSAKQKMATPHFIRFSATKPPVSYNIYMAASSSNPFNCPPLDVWIDISSHISSEKETTTFENLQKFATERGSGWMSLVDVSYVFENLLKKVKFWQIFSDDGTTRNSHTDAILLAKIQKGMITSAGGVYVSFR